MRTQHIFPTLVALALIVAAADCADAQRRTNVGEFGRPFTMKIGQTIQLNDLELTFRGVVDNRCHVGVVCVTAGNAKITLEVEQGDNAAVISLHTMADPKKVEWNGYTIQLVGLSAALPAAIPFKKQYRAEILVTR